MTSAHVIGFLVGLVVATVIWAWVLHQYRAGVSEGLRENTETIKRLIASANCFAPDYKRACATCGQPFLVHESSLDVTCSKCRAI